MCSESIRIWCSNRTLSHVMDVIGKRHKLTDNFVTLMITQRCMSKHHRIIPHQWANYSLRRVYTCTRTHVQVETTKMRCRCICVVGFAMETLTMWHSFRFHRDIYCNRLLHNKLMTLFIWATDKTWLSLAFDSVAFAIMICCPCIKLTGSSEKLPKIPLWIFESETNFHDE